MDRPNRHVRRKMRAQAAEIAAGISSRCLDFETGSPVAVTHPRAVAVLRRAFTMMIEQAQPVAIQLSDSEASGFPNWRESSRGMAHSLAVGVDVDGRASYAVRSAKASMEWNGPVSPLASAELAEFEAKDNLTRILMQSGIPGFDPDHG